MEVIEKVDAEVVPNEVAVATVTRGFGDVDLADEKIAAIQKWCGGLQIKDADDAKGYAEVVKYSGKLKTLVNKIDTKRKDINRDFKAKVDAEAERLTKMLTDAKTDLDGKAKTYETQLDAKRLAEEQKANELVTKRMAELKGLGADLPFLVVKGMSDADYLAELEKAKAKQAASAEQVKREAALKAGEEELKRQQEAVRLKMIELGMIPAVAETLAATTTVTAETKASAPVTNVVEPDAAMFKQDADTLEAYAARMRKITMPVVGSAIATKMVERMDKEFKLIIEKIDQTVAELRQAV